MTIRRCILISFLSLSFHFYSQEVSHTYKINQLLQRLKSPDTLYVVNFWATWCKPCVQELPCFDSLLMNTKTSKVKILLVCLDFKEDLDKRVNPFLLKNKTQAECVLLDEVNGNDYIDLISKSWSGAIPATFMKQGNTSVFIEKKLKLKDLEAQLEGFKTH
jgi:thiol-disulfide isomerase/thioredoxin